MSCHLGYVIDWILRQKKMSSFVGFSQEKRSVHDRVSDAGIIEHVRELLHK